MPPLKPLTLIFNGIFLGIKKSVSFQSSSGSRLYVFMPRIRTEGNNDQHSLHISNCKYLSKCST